MWHGLIKRQRLELICSDFSWAWHLKPCNLPRHKLGSCIVTMFPQKFLRPMFSGKTILPPPFSIFESVWLIGKKLLCCDSTCSKSNRSERSGKRKPTKHVSFRHACLPLNYYSFRSLWLIIIYSLSWIREATTTFLISCSQRSFAAFIVQRSFVCDFSLDKFFGWRFSSNALFSENGTGRLGWSALGCWPASLELN